MWEYKTKLVNQLNNGYIESILRDMGVDGWELVSANLLPNDMLNFRGILIFKRPKVT